MECQDVRIQGRTIMIPGHYQKVDSMPDDPKDSVPFVVRTENAICVALLFPVDESKALPRKKDSLTAGIRRFLGDNL